MKSNKERPSVDGLIGELRALVNKMKMKNTLDSKEEKSNKKGGNYEV